MSGVAVTTNNTKKNFNFIFVNFYIYVLCIFPVIKGTSGSTGVSSRITMGNHVALGPLGGPPQYTRAQPI
jgi:hypothetical protein